MTIALQTRSETIEQLRAGLRSRFGIVSGLRSEQNDDVCSLGVPQLDAMLPDQGLKPGSVCEWIADPDGSGPRQLAMFGLHAAMRARSEGVSLIVDPDRTLCPSSLVFAGLDLNRVVIARPDTRRDLLWTLEQSARCSGVVATLAPLDQATPEVCRRLKVAAEAGGGLVFLTRPAECIKQSSWADVRFHVKPISVSCREQEQLTDDEFLPGRRWKIELVALRNYIPGATTTIEVCDETGAVREASGVAFAKSSEDHFASDNRTGVARRFRLRRGTGHTLFTSAASTGHSRRNAAG